MTNSLARSARGRAPPSTRRRRRQPPRSWRRRGRSCIVAGTMTRRHVLIAIALVGTGASASMGLKSVFASGIPDVNPLYYSGTLTENGALATGQRAITVLVWPDAATSG